MANQQLVDYIKAQLAAGATKPDIHKAALGARWPLQEIESAFAAAEGRVAAPAPVVQVQKPVAPIVQAQPQAQPVPQEKPLPVIHMHPPGEFLRSGWLWSFVILLLLVGGAAAAYFYTPVGEMIRTYFAPAPVVEPVATIVPIPEQTYIDPMYGFSVTYPGSLVRLQITADEVFALANFSAAATTSPKVVTNCAPTAKAATTTINGIDFVVKTATSTASTTMQTYSTVHVGACLTLGVLDMSADPILHSFRFVATSTTAATSTTVAP